METQTRSHLRNKLREPVSRCSTLFHRVIKKKAVSFKSISHHPRVREGGAKPPRYSLFIMSRLLLILTILLLSTVPVTAVPLWLESRMDSVTLWFTPPSQKALLASETALERINELSENEEEAIEQIYTVQELLTVIEQNINIKGNPHKALRAQQEVERRLRHLQEKISVLDQKEKTEHYTLVATHASLRVNLLLKETELAKEKTRVKLDKENTLKT